MNDNIKKRWLYINLSFIFLAIIMLIITCYREKYLFSENINIFEQKLYDTKLAEITNEVNNRQDEINTIKNTKEVKIKTNMKNNITDINNSGSFTLEHLDPSTSNSEKKQIFIDYIIDYDLNDEEFKYFAFDEEGISLLTTYNPDTENIDIQDIIDTVTTNDTNDGFFTYSCPKEINGKLINKTSYIFYNKELDIIFGTGIYEDDYIEIVQENIFERLNSYYHNTDTYIYIIDYEANVYAHKNLDITQEDILGIKDLDNNGFHETIVAALQTSTEYTIRYKYHAEGMIDDAYVTKTGYIQSIDNWNMYIGMSFSEKEISISSNEYYKELFIDFSIYLTLLLVIIIGFAITIKKLYSNNLRDIKKEFENSNEKMEYISYHDHLTNLYNRSYMGEYTNSVTKADLPIGIVMGDANGLKMTNDTFGHEVGDELLVMISDTLTEVFNDCCIIRWGGDEFLIFIKNASKGKCNNLISKFKELTKNKMIKTLNISVSFGFSLSHSVLKDYKSDINEAEKMMYQQKLHESSSTKRLMVDNIINTLYSTFNFEKEHSENVMKYSKILGKELALSKEMFDKLSLGALLHDVGKISLSDKIINKKTPLTDEEWKEIRRHPAKGSKLLSAYAELEEYSIIVLHHHENWDGTGYPYGLKGEQIPLLSRIIAIADSYDAMREERVYKIPMTEKEALKELEKNKGTQFDPILIDIFIKAILTK